MPFNSFAEYAPEPNLETKKKDVVWFALNEDRPLFAFAVAGRGRLLTQLGRQFGLRLSAWSRRHVLSETAY